jgi:predicted AAA+ superfamily ATPase
MHSLDLEEFLWANQIPDDVVDRLKTNYPEKTPIDPFMHTRSIKLFRRYLIAGGMPAVISPYVATHDISEVIIRQKNSETDRIPSRISSPSRPLLNTAVSS